MKKNIISQPGELKISTRPLILYPLKLALLALVWVGLAGAANAITYTNANNASSALNLTADWLVAGGAPSVLPGTSDTILFTGATVTTPLGGSLSVNGMAMDTGATTSMRISSTAGATLTLGAGGITKTYAGNKMELSCNLALSANQTWTNAGNTIQVDSSAAWTFNGYTFTMTGAGTFDNRSTMNCGTNVNINCTLADMNYAAGDFNMGSGSNSFTTFTLTAGTVEGSTFPTNALATTASAFGAGSCAIALNGGPATLIYNGTTVATPEKITWGATGANAINVSQSGQTLTLSNLVYASGSGQTSNSFLNFGGAGNLTLARAVSNAPSSAYNYSINKSGGGTLTLTGTNLYSGNTLVNGGTFALTGNASISNTPVISLGAGTAFSVSGLNSTFVLQSSQTISNGSGSTASLVGSINAGSGTIAGNFKAGDAPFTTTNGTLTISSSTVFNLSYGGSSRLAVGTTFPIIAKGAGGSVSGTPPNTGAGTIAFTGWTGHLANNSGEVDLVVDSATLQGTEPLHWAGAGTGTWDAADSGNSIWEDSTTPSPLPVYYVDGDSVQFDEKYSSANQAVELDTTVNPTSILVSNATYNYTIIGGGAIGGSGGLTKLGAATLTLSTPNTYTGGTVISNGTVQMGNPTALGAKGTTVFVNSGAVLDMNGTVMTSANTNMLTLNGSGPAGGGALINSSATAANFFGPLSLGSASTIKAGGGSLTLGSGSADPVTGNYPLTFDTGSSTINTYGNIQAASVTKVGTGKLYLYSSNSFAGGFYLLSGFAYGYNNAAAFGAGTIYLGATNGSAASDLIPSTAATFNNPVIVVAGGSATPDLYNNGYALTWAGSITLSNNLQMRGSMTVSGPISGTGTLNFGDSGHLGPVTLTGTNTSSGATYVNYGTLALSGNGSISTNSPMASLAGGTTLSMSGSSTLAVPLVTLGSGATFDVSGLTAGSFTLGSGQTLANSTAATANLNGTINTGTGTVTVNYDGSDYVFNNSGSLNLSAGTVFNVYPTSVLPLATYTLVASGVAGTAPATVNMPRGGGYLQISGGALELVVTNDTSGPTEPLHWAGTGTGLWQLASPTNVWKDSSVTPVYTGFFPGDLVQLDEQYITTNQVVTLNSTVIPASVLVSDSTYNYTISGTGTIGGSASLTKTGNSNLMVQCALNLSGAFTNNGGTVQLVSGWPMTVGSLAGAGSSLDLTTNTLTVNQGGLNTTYSGVLHGYYPASAGTIGGHAFGLYVTNSGVLTLNSNITLSADASTLPASSGYSRISVGNAAELDLGGAVTLTNVSLRNGNTAITRVTGGTVNQTSTNTYFGIVLGDSSQFIVDNGSVSVPVVSIGFGGATTAGGSSLTINNGSLSVGAGNGRGLEIGNNVAAGTTSSLNLNGGVLTAVAIVDSPSVDPGLTQSANNVINFNGGTLLCASTNVIPADFGVGGANPLQLLVGNGGAVISDGGYSQNLILPLQNNGTGGLTKLGAGTLILAANNTYVGPTVVSNGALEVDGSIASASSVTVESGATLQGAGNIGGAVNFLPGSQALLNPASPLTIGGLLTVAAGGILPVVNVALSNNVPVGTYALATYSGGSGVFNSTPVIASGSLAVGTAGTIVTGGGTVSLQVAVQTQPNPTNIVMKVTGPNSLSLTWPAGKNWRLVGQTNSLSVGLTTNGWNTVPGGIDGSNGITINPNNPTVFYKLVYP